MIKMQLVTHKIYKLVAR